MDLLISNLLSNQFWTSGSGQTKNTRKYVFEYFQFDHFPKSKIDFESSFAVLQSCAEGLRVFFHSRAQSEEWLLIGTVQLIYQIKLQGWRIKLGMAFFIQLLNQTSVDFHTNNLFQFNPYFPILLFCQFFFSHIFSF